MSDKEIDRPLGQAAAVSRRSSRGFSLRAGPAVLVLAAIAIVAGSSLIAFRERPFRNPSLVAVSTPQVTEPAKVEAAAPAAPENTASQPTDGPSIIHVEPPQGASNGVVVIRDPSALGQNLRVAHLPDKALIEQSETGPLPIRAADGRRPFDVYARPWSGARGARVAIVIGGLGLSQTGTQQAIAKLPPEVTLAFAPGGNSISRWMQEGRRKGHEIVMQVALEPFDYPNVNPGRNTLTVAAPAAENLKNLRWTLSRTTNYTGVMNYMGARFAADAAAMGPVMAELGKRGLLYLDDGSTARSVAPELALKNRVPVAVADATIDAVRDRGEILKKLDQLESTARAKGFAIGTGSAFDMTVDAVSSWVEEAKRRGIEIVPISALATDPERG
ncbi:divergent polysaccharide deacetylase family protein [Mesorhizobium sp. CGMCC 1.15528]|uniref:Divergent polysaccharide deacetylase family protein n=1 Tax=Mesorhizobium zhangyense TaxID=1776730 RepID=A0A7C9R7L6_9HYPH|nr:divergent polysaccharide deacetylase family protein [Mesorhizobium zhangyense]NGN42134.1 divergent polysaccharide deacetylase family protein [Mesorhizobium zhangyense]